MTRNFGESAHDYIEQLARHSSDAEALTRLYLSREHRAAADLVTGWMVDAGMSVEMDALGTVRGHLASTNGNGNGSGGANSGARRLLIGSHIDTVRDAGKYDGNLGVVAGILAVRDLHERGVELPFGLDVLAFGDEEGVRFPTALLSSSAVAGSLDDESLEARDADGISVREALTAFGCEPDRFREAAFDPDTVLGYLEVHIEQGPVLETENKPLGIVTAIAGASRFKVHVRGEAGHAGTVPMALRHDALVAASALILEIERIATVGVRNGLVATVGEIQAFPGAVNVIPGEVRFTLDLRASSDEPRAEAQAAIQHAAREIGAKRGCVIGIEPFHGVSTVPCSDKLQSAMASAFEDLGQEPRRLMSGAGHDGQAMAKLTEIGMIFVRCRAGISHSPLEQATPEDMGLAVEALVRTIETLAEQERTKP